MIDANQVAEILGISRGAVYDLAAPKGPIPCMRLGRRCIRFDAGDVEFFKQQRMVTQEAQPLLAKTAITTRVLQVSGKTKPNCFQLLGVPTRGKFIRP